MDLKSFSCCRVFLVRILAFSFIFIGISIMLFFPTIFHNQLMKYIELRPDSKSFSEWKAPTALLYMDIYLFNWTNPHEIKNKSTKPTFTQLGPYRFREFPDKNKIKFNKKKTMVQYRKFSSYYFDVEGSNGTLDDLCTSVNMVALGAGSRAQSWNFLLQKSVSVSLGTYKEGISVVKTIRELLFEGYDDDLFHMSTIFSNDTPFERVGLLVSKNGTDKLSGDYGVSTGVGNISELGKIKTFNNLTELPYYEGECRKLKGSAGEFFQPSHSKEDPLYYFIAEMCRSIPFVYEKDVELQGVAGNRFSVGARALDNGTLYEENKCYATDQSMPSGVMNISVCNYDHPVFMSLPHFYEADASYLENVNGLLPMKEKHEAFITLEPTTGITLEVTARLQSNILMKQYGEHITLFKNVPRVYLPVFWVEQKFVLGSDKVGLIRLALRLPLIGQIFGACFMILGIALLVFDKTMKIITKPKVDSIKNVNKSIGQEINPLLKA